MSEQRRPGRPQIADPDAIARAAVALFAEHGYHAVTMDDVAAASSVSRRTLFRHFTSKADLVWRDFFATYARISEEVVRERPAPGMEGVRALMRGGLEFTPEQEEHARVCLRIIGASPEVFAAGVGGVAQVVVGLERHFSRTEDGEQDSLEARVAGQSVMGAILAASVWWAQESEEPLADVVDRALAGLAAGIG